jgi:hypothetical protein
MILKSECRHQLIRNRIRVAGRYISSFVNTQDITYQTFSPLRFKILKRKNGHFLARIRVYIYITPVQS